MSALSDIPMSYALRGSGIDELGSSIPAFIYGTAWKGPETAQTVAQALEAGFTAIDTAAQPRHYREDFVGQSVKQVLSHGALLRKNLFLQTKFTPLDGQDLEGLPYRPEDSVADQVRSSVASSIAHLCGDSSDSLDGTYIDCVMLHSPLDTLMNTLIAWHTLEGYVPHRIRYLGISNIDLGNLELLWDLMTVKPVMIQNRFFEQNLYDASLRKFCVKNGIVYQAFGCLTMNPHLLNSKTIDSLGKSMEVKKEMALYCLILGLGNIVILNGTKNLERMKEDIRDLDRCRLWVQETTNQSLWRSLLSEFKGLVGNE